MKDPVLLYMVGALLIVASGLTGYTLGFMLGRRTAKEKHLRPEPISEDHRRHHEEHHNWGL
jgi:hypothetical protein